MIGASADLDGRAFAREQRDAVAGAEDDVDENVGERLRHRVEIMERSVDSAQSVWTQSFALSGLAELWLF